MSTFINPELKSIDKIHVDKINFKKVDLRFDLLISNANTYSIKLKSVDADVYIGDKLMGNILADTMLVLKNNSTSRLSVTLNSSPEKIVRNLPDILQAIYFEKIAKVKIEGDVKVKARGISKQIHFEITEKVAL